MTITIELQPDIERGLSARAQAKGVSLVDFAQEILTREVSPAGPSSNRTGQELVDSCARMRGLLTDGEIDRLFRRNPSPSRPVDFS
jgi:hypothetical protein